MTHDELTARIADGTLTVGELIKYREAATPEQLDVLKLTFKRLNLSDVLDKVQQVVELRREVDALTVEHNWFSIANGEADLLPR